MSRVIAVAAFVALLAPSSATATGNEAMATGSGQLEEGHNKIVQLSAVKNAQGDVHGFARFEQAWQAAWAGTAEGPVVCVATYGNAATASFKITKSSDPSVIGRYIAIFVEDNGQGTLDRLDNSGFMFSPSCPAPQWSINTRTLRQGNFVVK